MGRIEGEKKQRASDVENRDRMVRMRDDKDKYLESLLKERKNVFEKKIAEFNVLVAEERKIRLERRKDERQEERRRKWMREREEEEQRRRDELAIKEKEEREAREALEKQREKEEYEKKKAELEEIPLLKLQVEEFKEEAKVVWEEQEKDRIEGEKKQRASDVENRDRMVRMRDDKDKYLESLLKERKNVFEKKIAEFNVLVAEERKIRLERRKDERQEERR